MSILGDPEAFEDRLADDPRRWVLALAAAEGLVGALSYATNPKARPEPYGALIALPILVVTLAPLFGVIGLYVNGLLLDVAGRMLGGNARPEQLRAAQAWAGLPALFGALVLVPRAVAAWRGFALATPAGFDPLLGDLLRTTRTPASLFLQALAVISVWRLSAFVAVAQGFSPRRAFASELLAALLGIISVVAVGATAWGVHRLVG